MTRVFTVPITHTCPTIISLGPAGRHITLYVTRASVLNDVNKAIGFLVNTMRDRSSDLILIGR